MAKKNPQQWEYTTECKVTKSRGVMCMDSFIEP